MKFKYTTRVTIIKKKEKKEEEKEGRKEEREGGRECYLRDGGWVERGDVEVATLILMQLVKCYKNTLFRKGKKSSKRFQPKYWTCVIMNFMNFGESECP